jgi:hypothetical protein
MISMMDGERAERREKKSVVVNGRIFFQWS